MTKKLLTALALIFILGCTDEPDATDPDFSGSDDLPSPPYDVYLVVNHMELAKMQDSCDINGNGSPNNAMVNILNNPVLQPFIKEDPNATLKQKIEAGEALAVIGGFGVDDFFNDNEITIEAFQGSLVDPDSPAPADLFSGHGTVSLPDASLSSLDAGISDGVISTNEESTYAASIPFEDQMFDVVLYRATVRGLFEQEPNSHLLDGRVSQGLICGAINAEELGNMAVEAMDIAQNQQALIKQTINSIANLECDGGPCVSVALNFTAVSVQVTH